MNENQIIMERIEKLERQNRMFKYGSLALLAVIANVIFGAASGGIPDVIEAKKFVVKDDAGRTRCVMATSEKGSYFHIFDTKGNARIEIDDIDDAVGMFLYSENQKKEISIFNYFGGNVFEMLGGIDISQFKTGETRLSMFDSKGGSIIDLYTSINEPHFKMKGKEVLLNLKEENG